MQLKVDEEPQKVFEVSCPFSTQHHLNSLQSSYSKEQLPLLLQAFDQSLGYSQLLRL
jgi:hypothetical protein